MLHPDRVSHSWTNWSSDEFHVHVCLAQKLPKTRSESCHWKIFFCLSNPKTVILNEKWREMLHSLIYLLRCLAENQMVYNHMHLCLFNYCLLFSLFYYESVPCRQVGRTTLCVQCVTYILRPKLHKKISIFAHVSCNKNKSIVYTDRTDNEKRCNSYQNTNESSLFVSVMDLTFN